VTPSEEVIFADRQKQKLFFLDFTHNIKIEKADLSIKDMHFANNRVYVLTKRKIIIYDEYGNAIESRNIPERSDRIYVDSTHIYLFSFNKDYFHELNEEWKKVDFAHGIRDICTNHEIIVILNKNGSTLYFYNRSDL
jgi:hypothetical protein